MDKRKTTIKLENLPLRARDLSFESLGQIFGGEDYCYDAGHTEYNQGCFPIWCPQCCGCCKIEKSGYGDGCKYTCT
jgi:hypothetical protein